MLVCCGERLYIHICRNIYFGILVVLNKMCISYKHQPRPAFCMLKLRIFIWKSLTITHGHCVAGTFRRVFPNGQLSGSLRAGQL